MAPALVWDGPPIDDIGTSWQSDPDVARTVAEAVRRDLSPDAAAERVARFAESLSKDGREARLTRLFAGIFTDINAERGRVIDMIRTYARAQATLLARIDDDRTALERLSGQQPADRKAIEDLAARIDMAQRVLEDRERALRPLCEQPVLLEQKLGRLARIIQGQLE